MSNYSNINNPKARTEVLNLIDENNLVDVWRYQHPGIKRYTWRQKTPFKQSRLDFILVSEDFLSYPCNTSIETGYRTDHSCPTLEIKLLDITRGRGFWKFNNSLLYDHNYISMVKEIIKENVKQYATSIPSNFDTLSRVELFDIKLNINDQLFLEILMMGIRGKTIAFASNKKKEQEIIEKQLEEEIKNIDTLLSQMTADTSLEQKLYNLKNELEAHRKEKLKGVFIRSKARWVEHGEKPSKYFCSLEKRNYVTKALTMLIDNKNNVLETQKQIEKEVVDFYKTLYTSRDDELINVDLNGELHNCTVAKLTDNVSESLEGELTYNEVTNVLKKMNNFKSPGTDGYTAEFIKFFWSDISSFVIKSLNFVYKRGQLSDSQKLGLITLIPKKDKAKEYIKNWRPISLLNVIYKLGSATIAERIKNVLPSLVSMDQNGFIQGRSIGNNIRLIYDTLHYTTTQNKPGMLLLVDFEKAFDTISWIFITKVLSYFKFGHSIQKWITVFYNECESCLSINGNITERFKLGRGCRQGDPLSPYIFILCVEILGILVRNNKNIKGIEIYGNEFKISQFADDTTLLLDWCEQTLIASMETLQYFTNISGLKVNIDKTNIIRLGKDRNDHRKMCPKYKLKWTTEFTVLGVQFSTNLYNIQELNYNVKLKEVKKLLEQWSKRSLTTLGKIAVIKSLALSKFVYLFSSLPNPTDALFKTLETYFFQFIWNKKPDKIARKTLIRDYQKGGLRAIDVKLFCNAQKLSWMKSVYLNQDITCLLSNCLQSKAELLLTLGSAYSKAKSQICTNHFWKNVLFIWSLFLEKCESTTDKTKILNLPIWYNSFIKINNKYVYYKTWANKGILFLKDLFNNTTWLTYDEFCMKYYFRPPFTVYNGLILAIKTYYKMDKYRELGTVQMQIIPNCLKELLKTNVCKKFYKECVNGYTSKHKINPQIKWHHILGTELCDKWWENVYLIPFKLTTDTGLRYFQYKIFYFILTTNRQLVIYGIKKSDTCEFCHMFSEDLMHIFWLCKHVQTFWNTVINWIFFKTKIRLQVNAQTIILGNPNYSKKDSVVNLIILIAKQYIYKSKCKSQQLTLTGFQKSLNMYYYIDKYISTINDTVIKFEEKWNVWTKLIV